MILKDYLVARPSRYRRPVCHKAFVDVEMIGGGGVGRGDVCLKTEPMDVEREREREEEIT